MHNYKELKVWKKNHHFTRPVYAASKSFLKEEIYNINSQLRRSASSIPATIAEGCGKNTQPESGHYLNIALGSANESEYFLILSGDLKYLLQKNFDSLSDIINECKAMLITLLNKVRKTSSKPRT